MGLLKAALSSAGGVLKDQWKEYFYCDALPETILVQRGYKKTTAHANKGDDNVISNGSVIAVADGQCMLIIDNGKVVDLCAEPGEYIYDMSTEPSLLDGGKLADNIKAVFATIGKRFTFAGETAKTQRVYYFNTKELTGNKYGTPSPVPFRVVDNNIGLDMDISIKCFGEYSYRVSNPLLFYTNVCSNVANSYDRSQLDSQLKTELLTALQPAFARISDMGIRYSALPGHTMELADALNEVLSKKWRDLRGIEIVSFGVSSMKADEEDEKMIKEMQRSAVLRDPNMAGARLAEATASAMQTAAGNANGAAMGFMGMNMAGQAAGTGSISSFYQMGAQQPQPQQAAAGSWTCSCGATATGKFCPECGAKKPEAAGSWTCSCGTVNTGKFCAECGAKKPEASGSWTCSCGTVNTGKFCADCGAKRP